MREEPVRIEMLGGFRVILGGRVLDHFRTRKAASLLARLALFPDRAHPREELIDLLWPEMDVEAGRVNLRQALCSLRHLLEDNKGASRPMIVGDNGTVRLAPDTFVTDVAQFEESLAGASREGDNALEARMHAIEQYRGELLNGYYDEWILTERRRMESLYLSAIHDQQTAYVRRGEPLCAVPYALRAVQLDPYNEESHLQVMRLYASAGDPSAVKRQYNELARMLKDELDEEPSGETRDQEAKLCEEATANEAALRERMQLNPAASGGFVLSRPVWKRPAAAFAAFACMGAISFLPVLRSQQSHASGPPLQSVEERSAFDLRNLRTVGFVTGTPKDREAARRRHAEICLALGERAWNSWYGRDEEKWLNRMTAADEELRTALHWLLENDPERAVQLSGTLTRFWFVRNFPREGYRWLSESLERSSGSRTTARARALIGCALLSTVYDAKANSQCSEALSICIERGDKWGEAHALRHLGFLAGSRAEFASAKRYYDRALAKFTELRDDRGMAVTFLCLSFLKPETEGIGRPLCRKSAERSLDLFKRLENPWGVSMALNSLGNLETDHQKARSLIQQALAAYPEANGLSEKENHERAMLAMQNGDYQKARTHLIREIQIARDRNNRMGVAYALGTLTLLPSNNQFRTARLFGAYEALNVRLGIDIGPSVQAMRNNMISRLGQSRFQSAEQEGRKLSWEQAVDEAAGMK